MTKVNIIYGAGYSLRALNTFVETLLKNKIDMLVDVRTYPVSRYFVEFNKKNLSETLSSVGVTYRHEGRRIGGKKANVGFEAAVDELVKMARAGIRVCLMCAEAKPENCHRTTVLKPALAKRGIELVEIKFSENTE